MVKATLRKSGTAPTPATVDVEATTTTPVENETSPAAVQGQDLTKIIPEAEVVDQGPQEPGEQTSQAVAHRPQSALAVRHNGADEDGFDESDNKYPTLRIVAGSGKLSTMFNVGSLILGTTIDESEAIFGPPDPKGKEVKLLRFVPLALKKSYRENLTPEEIEAGGIPRIFNTLEEVEEAGLTTQWFNNTPPTAKPSATCVMLIEQPEGFDAGLFQLCLDGKYYCPAVFYAGNSAYKAFAQTLYNVGRTVLQVPVMEGDQPKKDAKGFIVKRKYYPKHPWTFQVKQTVKKKDNRDFTVFVPEIKVQSREETGPELRAYINELIPQASALDAE